MPLYTCTYSHSHIGTYPADLVWSCSNKQQTDWILYREVPLQLHRNHAGACRERSPVTRDWYVCACVNTWMYAPRATIPPLLAAKTWQLMLVYMYMHKHTFIGLPCAEIRQRVAWKRPSIWAHSYACMYTCVHLYEYMRVIWAYLFLIVYFLKCSLTQ